jgi:hypothetical protein
MGPTTSMPEQLLFELKDARVTPHIATFGGTWYQIATIGSVHVARRKRSNPLAVIIFLLGLGILDVDAYLWASQGPDNCDDPVGGPVQLLVAIIRIVESGIE